MVGGQRHWIRLQASSNRATGLAWPEAMAWPQGAPQISWLVPQMNHFFICQAEEPPCAQHLTAGHQCEGSKTLAAHNQQFLP